MHDRTVTVSKRSMLTLSKLGFDCCWAKRVNASARVANKSRWALAIHFKQTERIEFTEKSVSLSVRGSMLLSLSPHYILFMQFFHNPFRLKFLLPRCILCIHAFLKRFVYLLDCINFDGSPGRAPSTVDLCVVNVFLYGCWLHCELHSRQWAT